MYIDLLFVEPTYIKQRNTGGTRAATPARQPRRCNLLNQAGDHQWGTQSYHRSPGLVVTAWGTFDNVVVPFGNFSADRCFARGRTTMVVSDTYECLLLW